MRALVETASIAPPNQLLVARRRVVFYMPCWGPVIAEAVSLLPTASGSTSLPVKLATDVANPGGVGRYSIGSEDQRDVRVMI